MSKKKFIYLSVYLTFVVVLTVPIVISLKQINDVELDILQVEENIDDIKSEIEELELELEMTDDLEYIEKIVRERYGYIKADEVVFKSVE